MHPAIEHFLGSGYRYNFQAGPDVIRTHDDAREHGLNCGALVHILTREVFEIELPPRLMCLELFHDREYLDVVEPPYSLQLGDIIFFGSSWSHRRLRDYEPEFNSDGLLVDWRKHPSLHLGFCTDLRWNTEPVIIHSSRRTGGPNICALHTFPNLREHEKICGVRRLKPQYRTGL